MRFDLAAGLVVLAVVYAAVTYALLGVRTIGPDLEFRLLWFAAATVVAGGLMVRRFRSEPVPACDHRWNTSAYYRTRQCARCGQRETFRVRGCDPGDGHPHAADWGAD